MNYYLYKAPEVWCPEGESVLLGQSQIQCPSTSVIALREDVNDVTVVDAVPQSCKLLH